AQNLQAVRLALFQCGQDHRFEMAAQFIAVNGFHAIILDRLVIKVNRRNSDVEVWTGRGAWELELFRRHCPAERVPWGEPAMGMPKGSGRALTTKPSAWVAACNLRNSPKLSG